MLKRLCFIAFILFTACVAGAVAEESVTHILRQITNRYGSLPGLQVPYEREIISQTLALMNTKSKGDLASGRIYFKPPQSLKIEQSKPKPETIVSDGALLWWYIPEKKEAHRYAATQLGKELSILNEIFQGLKKADEHFDVKLLNPEAQKDRFQLQLRPRPPWPDIEQVRLETLEDGRIRAIEIVNYAGGLTRFILGDVAVKKSFKKNFFSFDVPKGVQVIEEAQ